MLKSFLFRPGPVLVHSRAFGFASARPSCVPDYHPENKFGTDHDTIALADSTTRAYHEKSLSMFLDVNSSQHCLGWPTGFTNEAQPHARFSLDASPRLWRCRCLLKDC